MGRNKETKASSSQWNLYLKNKVPRNGTVRKARNARREQEHFMKVIYYKKYCLALNIQCIFLYITPHTFFAKPSCVVLVCVCCVMCARVRVRASVCV